MELYPLDNSDKLTGIVIEHRGKRIVSEGSIFDRTPFPSTGELFMDINQFWATLPAETQDRIFAIYSEIEDTFLTTSNDARLHERVTQLVGELYRQWEFADLSRWVRLYARTVVPVEIQSTMGEYSSEDRTYLRDDYVGLICLVTHLRAMIPIWNRYVRESRKTSGTHFKEFMAMGLLNNTNILQLPEFEKVRVYTRRNVDAGKITMSAIVAGVGSADLEDWVFGVVLIRKVCVGVVMHCTPDGEMLSTYNSSTNIISNIFRQIESTLNSLDRKFNGQVRKKPDGMEFRDDDKESQAEKIIVKQQINDYKFILAGEYARFITRGRDLIDPTLPMELIEACTDHLRRDTSFTPSNAQLALAQWVIHPALSARFVPALEQPECVNVMGMAQALYWHWGFYDLALLMTAHYLTMDDDQVFGNESRSRVTTEQFRILCEQYPFYHRRSNNHSREQQRNENAAMIAIEKLYTMFDSRPYRLSAPAELVNKTTMRPYGSGGWLIPSDIKLQLADFIIKLNNHKKGV